MIKYFAPMIALVALSIPTITFADASDKPITMTRDGQTFTYTVSTRKNVTFIDGTDVTSGDNFSYRVARGYVSGTIGGTPVAFKVSDVEHPVTVSSAR